LWCRSERGEGRGDRRERRREKEKGGRKKKKKRELAGLVVQI
jgi:hypothetical protein